ncbi:MAG: hypothetical protein RL154_138 [Pseudomonadota bacterium]|jgi:chemotaxis protein CheX
MNNFDKSILTPIAAKTVQFLKDEMQLSIDENYAVDIEQTITPFICSTVIGVGGAINFLFFMSYEDSVLSELVKKFAYGEIGEGEIEELKEATALEIANTVIGHAIVDMPNGGKGITITPPILMDNCSIISKTKKSSLIKFDIKTDYGIIMLAVIFK